MPMKTKILLLFGLLISMQGSVKAQDVFPKSDAIWVIHLAHIADFSGPFYPPYGTPAYEAEQYVYGIAGDTIINDIEYQKLYLLNDNTLDIDDGDVYVAGIRQAGKQVWIKPADRLDGTPFEEYLLYDFSKQQGETVDFGKRPLAGWMGIGNDCPSCKTFEDVLTDNLLPVFGYINHQADDGIDVSFGFEEDSNSFGFDTWVEGIGSLSGLYFHPPANFTMCGGACRAVGGILICMMEKGEIKYLKEGCTSCFESPVYLSLSSDELDKSVDVKYNAVQKAIEVNLSDITQNIQLELVSLDGKLIQTIALSDLHTSVNVSQLPVGVYLYKVKSGNLNKAGKFVVN